MAVGKEEPSSMEAPGRRAHERRHDAMTGEAVIDSPSALSYGALGLFPRVRQSPFIRPKRPFHAWRESLRISLNGV